VLVSHQEPPFLKALGEPSNRPEEYGVDFLYYTRMGLVGVQRKEYGDLIASVMGDRVYRECLLMKRLDIGIWVIEGRPQWTSDGQLVSRQQWSQSQDLGVRLSLQSRGFWLISTENLQGTATFLSTLSVWCEKDSHSGLNVRPKPQTEWGHKTDQDWAIHLLQGFPMIGPETARNIFTRLKVPLMWSCTMADLQTVPGVGPKRARKLWEALNDRPN
jgi:ERCC4-type nuclease